MRVNSKYMLLLSVLLMLSSIEISAQSHKLPEPQMETKQAVPPPPGLPIDFGISALIAAGIGLGVFHLKNKK